MLSLHIFYAIADHMQQFQSFSVQSYSQFFQSQIIPLGAYYSIFLLLLLPCLDHRTSHWRLNSLGYCSAESGRAHATVRADHQSSVPARQHFSQSERIDFLSIRQKPLGDQHNMVETERERGRPPNWPAERGSEQRGKMRAGNQREMGI